DPVLFSSGGPPFVFTSGLTPTDSQNYLAVQGTNDGFFPFVLNSYKFQTDSQVKAMLLGMTGVYESFNSGLVINNVSPAGISGNVTALAYGARNNPDAAYVATDQGQLFVRAAPGPTFTPMTSPCWAAGAFAQRIVMTPDDYRIAYVLDNQGNI